MGKNLLARIGLTIFLTASTILYQGCAEPTSYEEKCNSLNSQLEYRRIAGNNDSPVIPPLLKFKNINFNN